MIPPPSFLPHTARRRWPVLEWTSARTPTERAPPQRLSCDLGEGLRTPKRGGGALHVCGAPEADVASLKTPSALVANVGSPSSQRILLSEDRGGGVVDMTFLIPVLLWVFMMSSSLICPQHFLFVVGSRAGGKPNS